MIKVTIKLEVKYSDNVTMNKENYFKIGNDNIWELVSEVKIGKLVSLGYFDNQ